MFNKILSALLVVLILAYAGYKLYLMPKFGNGAAIPEISADLLNGEEFRLSDLKGSFVLLDFWGSWCGPCRRDNPNLVALYETFNGQNFKQAKGFEIVNVAIETSEKSWKRAIEKDGLSWKYHILQNDLFKSPIAKEFGVREIPTKYLLNPKGEIIAVNPNKQEVTEVLQKALLD